MNKTVAVIGSGGWGTAISTLLARCGFRVNLWSYLKEESEQLTFCRENKAFLPGIILDEAIHFTHSMEEATKNADFIIMVPPSKAIRQTAEALSPFVKKGQIIVNASKGLDQDTYKRLSVTIKDAIPQAEVAVISGPSHAEEVARQMPTTNVVAARTEEVAEYIQDAMMCDFFRIYTSLDMTGVELGGALKNVIALCAGVSDGLGLGDNTKAALMTRGMSEIARLGVACGAEVATFSGLSGMGDLIVTCTSMHSRNRRAGILIGQGKTAQEAMEEVKMVVEGVYTTKAAYHLAKRMNVEMPITECAYAVLFEGLAPQKALEMLMSRDKRHENDRAFRFIQ
ncbi:MAG: NAD(P)H-dependent glycerol-3-phosphate dehydrogenase [Clostridia bacterium]|nr:NAD(P)H-dependent glycerol-3-phosphate dehydrogenase [Clostridia bacterium]